MEVVEVAKSVGKWIRMELGMADGKLRCAAMQVQWQVDSCVI